MAKGITIESGSPRTLSLEGAEVAQGGSANQAGLYAVGSKLYLDGAEIADEQGSTGLLIGNGELTFNGQSVGDDTPPTPPVPSSGLWIPPMQAESNRNAFSYRDYITAYDALMTSSGYSGTIKKYEYRETQISTKVITDSKNNTPHTVPVWSGSFVEVAAGVYNDVDGIGLDNYPLYHYEFTPNGGYTKTFFVNACIHGNEKDGPQTLLRIMDIICNHANEGGYSRLAPLRDNVRWIVIPVVNVRGLDTDSMNRPYLNWDGVLISDTPSMNMNRNMDVNHVYGLNSPGTGGNYPKQVSETRHIDQTIKKIGVENIDYAVDYHDGEGRKKHYWFNYNADGANAPVMRKLRDDLIAYEEELRLAGGTDYRRPDGTNEGAADIFGYVHPDVCDSFGTTGALSAWFNNTLGLLGSVCEYLGGIFGYGFTSEQMTRSLRIRANLLIYAYELIATKGWQVNEDADADYFHFDYPISMTRQGLRSDAAASLEFHGIVTHKDVYDRWDELVSVCPSYVTKSAKLGENTSGDSIYSYTLGSGQKKVLFIGGNMRWLAAHKETEFGMYVLAQYLCNDYVVNQSAFLKRLKQDYTIAVIPCIDIKAGGNSNDIKANGLNAAGLVNYAKWKEENGVCVPTDYALNTAADVPIFLSWLSANQDAIVLVSGGEDTSVYGGERPDYTTDYMTQFVVPRSQTIPLWLTGYCTHLENDRGEDKPSVVQTQSVVDSNVKIGLTCGDYAYDTHGIETYFINLKVSNKWAEREQYMKSGDSSESYMYRTYETGRRIANIVNIFLMAGGDIAAGGGLVNKND